MDEDVLNAAIGALFFIVALLLVVLLSSCAPRAARPHVVPIHAETDGKLHILVGESSGKTLVVVPQERDLKDGLKIIGCGTAYICTPDRVGVLYTVTKVQK